MKSSRETGPLFAEVIVTIGGSEIHEMARAMLTRVENNTNKKKKKKKKKNCGKGRPRGGQRDHWLTITRFNAFRAGCQGADQEQTKPHGHANQQHREKQHMDGILAG